MADLKFSGATETTPVSTDMIPFARVADATARHMTVSALKTWLFDQAIVFNESGADVNYRFEGSGNANLLFLDGGDDRIGVGTATPNTRVEIAGLTLGDNQYGTLYLSQTTNDGTYYSQATGFLTLAQDSSGNNAISQEAYYDGANNAWKHSTANAAYGPVQITFGYAGTTIFNRKAAGAHSIGDSITWVESMRIDASGNVGIGTASPNQELTIEGTMSLKEQAAADADTAGYGQLWIKNTSPCELWFTDDAGADTKLA